MNEGQRFFMTCAAVCMMAATAFVAFAGATGARWPLIFVGFMGLLAVSFMLAARDEA